MSLYIRVLCRSLCKSEYVCHVDNCYQGKYSFSGSFCSSCTTRSARHFMCISFATYTNTSHTLFSWFRYQWEDQDLILSPDVNHQLTRLIQHLVYPITLFAQHRLILMTWLMDSRVFLVDIHHVCWHCVFASKQSVLIDLQFHLQV